MNINNSVGIGGSNNRNDVFIVQKKLQENGFPGLADDGVVGVQTISAIKNFQRRFMHFPDGIISPNGATEKRLFNKQVISADNASSIPVDMSGTLHVKSGQVTFDAEGNDSPASPYFSRVLHWPGGASGVTIGRGYDMKARTEKSVYNDLFQSGVDPHIASLMSKGHGLHGNKARDFVRQNKQICGSITRSMQVNLFSRIYPAYVSRAQTFYDSYKSADCTPWSDLKAVIKDVIVDMCYQGVLRKLDIEVLGQNDTDLAIRLISSTPRINKYENGRHRISYLKRGL